MWRGEETCNSYPASLHPGLGQFPLFDIKEKNQLTTVMYQREAAWLSFGQICRDGCAIRIGVGCSTTVINTITGEPYAQQAPLSGVISKDDEEESAAMQDYVACPLQPWIDGFHVSSSPPTVRQFVAVPLGQGETVTEQVTGVASGGLTIEVIPRLITCMKVTRRDDCETININKTPRQLGIKVGDVISVVTDKLCSYRDVTLTDIFGTTTGQVHLSFYNHGYEIFVRLLSGNTHVIVVNPCDSIERVKEIIQEKRSPNRKSTTQLQWKTT